MPRARVLIVTLGVLLALTAACRGPNLQAPDKRLVILGFDGMDPDLLERRIAPGRFLLGYFPIARPQAISRRGGASFWVTAGQAGIRSSILTVPGTYPPEE